MKQTKYELRASLIVPALWGTNVRWKPAEYGIDSLNPSHRFAG